MNSKIQYSYFSFPKNSQRVNEDSILLPMASGESIFFGIADGVGGEKYGDIASEKIVSLCRKILKNSKQISIKAILENVWIDYVKFVEKNTKLYSSATTFTLCKLSKYTIEFGHVGDCRAYIINNNKINQVTADHTLKNKLTNNIKITDDFYTFDNVITSYFSYKNKYCADIFKYDLEDNMKVLICSDGVYKVLNTKEILLCLNSSNSIKESVEILCKEVQRHNPNDDYSAIYVAL